MTGMRKVVLRVAVAAFAVGYVARSEVQARRAARQVRKSPEAMRRLREACREHAGNTSHT